MNPVALLVVALAVPRLAGQPPQQHDADLVEVVGCLSQAPDKAWILTSGSDPVVTKTIFTTKEALKEAQARPLGNRRYRLLGPGPFTPELHKGEKMAARGVLIKDDKESRLNLTSLQSVAAACGK